MNIRKLFSRVVAIFVIWLFSKYSRKTRKNIRIFLNPPLKIKKSNPSKCEIRNSTYFIQWKSPLYILFPLRVEFSLHNHRWRACEKLNIQEVKKSNNGKRETATTPVKLFRSRFGPVFVLQFSGAFWIFIAVFRCGLMIVTAVIIIKHFSLACQEKVPLSIDAHRFASKKKTLNLKKWQKALNLLPFSSGRDRVDN